MGRVIKTNEVKPIGKCIYCGTNEGKLSDEHITPFGLNGRLVLGKASCEACAKITAALESRILKDMLFAARARSARTPDGLEIVLSRIRC